jgi:hypothetical protein
MRSEMAVSENLHASIQLSRGLAASNRTIRHRNTCDLHSSANSSLPPLQVTSIEASSPPASRPIRQISLRQGTSLYFYWLCSVDTELPYFEYSSITLLGFTYPPNAVYSRSYPKDLGPPIAMPSFESFHKGEHAIPMTVTR